MKQDLSDLVNIAKTLPEYVFLEDWDEFLFFDSDWTCSPDFIKFTSVVLEDAVQGCVTVTEIDGEGAHFTITAATTWEMYNSFLKGIDLNGLLYSMHRFVVSSAMHDWCLYVERASDIAVLACKSNATYAVTQFAEIHFNARPTRQAIKSSLSVGFCDLPASYTARLIESYCSIKETINP